MSSTVADHLGQLMLLRFRFRSQHTAANASRADRPGLPFWPMLKVILSV